MKSAFDQTRRLGSADELGGRATCDLQALGDLSKARTAGVALRSLHDEEQLVLDGSEAARGEDLGAPPLEPAKRSPQLGSLLEVTRSQPFLRVHRSQVLQTPHFIRVTKTIGWR